MQTKKQSLLESITNMGVWYFTAVGSTFIVFPMFNINIPPQDNLLIWLYFTLISLLRSYAIRRYFNKKKYGFNKKTQKRIKRNMSKT